MRGATGTGKNKNKQMKKINIILSIAVVALVVLCYLSISAPMRFDREREARETVVKRRLMQIRSAAERYRHATGAYTGSMATLVKGRWLADSLQYIPFGGGRRFRLEASSVTSRSGRSVPVMECSATYADYLRGLDANSVHNLTVAAESAGRFAGLKIGDLAEPNDNNGNWE